MISKLVRAYVRRKTGVIDEEVAYKWRKRLSIAYMLIGWNLLSYTMYICFKDKYPDAQAEDKYDQILNYEDIDKAKVIRFTGFQSPTVFEVSVDKNN